MSKTTLLQTTAPPWMTDYVTQKAVRVGLSKAAALRTLVAKGIEVDRAERERRRHPPSTAIEREQNGKRDE